MSRRVEDLVPALQPLARVLVVAARLVGHPVLITGTLRTWAEQDALYAQGRTAPGPRVTNARGGESWHNFGRAFDVAFVVEGGGVTWEGPWEMIGKLGEALGLEWGGRWQRPDRPHFQLREGLTLAAARRAHHGRRVRL